MTSFGRSVRRVEDDTLLTGRARFVDDLAASAGALQLGILRSPFAHATFQIASRQRSEGTPALVFDDVAHLEWAQLLPGPPPLHALAAGRCRYEGEPVAAVLGKDADEALERLARIEVDFDPLPAAIGVEEASGSDAPLVYDELGTNVAHVDESERDPRMFDSADIVIRRTFRNHRIAPAMLEPRAVVAVPEQDGAVTVYVSHQHAHKLRDELSRIFRISREKVRVVVPEVGGGFGAKSSLYPEYVLAVHAAMDTGRPVKFIESRSENLTVTAQGRGQVQRVEVGATAAGELTGLRVAIDADFGAAVDLQRWSVALTRRMLGGAYRIPRIEWSIRGVLTHSAPVGAFRGAGRPEAAYLVERVIDELARELKLDPAEVRKRNFVPGEAFPYATGTGVTYDSGAYGDALRVALDVGRYADWRQRQSAQNQPGTSRRLGIGIASYVEMSAAGTEYAQVTVNASGDVSVRTGTSPHGQGHHTAWAQLVADGVGVDLDRVTVHHGDTALIPRGGGTSGSRSAVLGGSAAADASEEVASILRSLAAERLEAAAADIRLHAGRAGVVGTDVGIDIAELVHGHGSEIVAANDFTAPGHTHPFGSHLCVLEIDLETGAVAIVDYTAVDDCGRVINPLLVEGQLLGGMLQGISHALAEQVRFEDGQLVTGTLAAYPVPSIGSVPRITTLRTETPSPANPLGLKGVGESGITGATAAVANAVFDAVSGLGLDEATLGMPFTPSRVWTGLRRAAS